MKTLLVPVFALVSLSIAHATELEVRVFHLVGEEAPLADIIRFSEAGLLPSSVSFTTTIGVDGAFSHSATQPVRFARSIDNAGRPAETANRDVGLSFSGRATAVDDHYLLTYEFATTALQGITFSRSDNGTLFPQPVIQTSTIKSSAHLQTDDWAVMPIGTPKDDSRTVILLRIRK
jgi:hypothetical protein